MASRNRTILFRKYRDELKSMRAPSSSSSSSLPSSSSSSHKRKGIELVANSLLRPNGKYTPLSTDYPTGYSKAAVAVGLPPTWVDVSEDVASNVQRARLKMAELTKAHAKALMPSFGDGKEDQQRIETLTQEITAFLRRSEKMLLRLSVGGPSEDSNIRKNVQRALATDLQSLSMELRKKQSSYLKRLQQQQKEVQDGVDLEMNFNGSKSRLADDVLDQLVFNEHQMTKIKKTEELTSEREREIEQVVQSVNELAQIMKDLSVLVIDQGTIIDRIDYNIQNVAASVEEGFKQLKKAERNQKEGGLVKCATVLVIMCLIMMVILVFKEIIF